MEQRKKRNLVIVASIIIALSYILYVKTSDKFVFEKYFSDYGKTYCVTIDEVMGNKAMSSSVSYLYNVKGVVYKGVYITNVGEEKKLDFPKKKYMIVYSKIEPSYPVVFPISINSKKDIEEVNIPINRVKEKFTVLRKAEVVKTKE